MRNGNRRHSGQEPAHLQHAAEHERPRGKTHVMSYLVILFAAAFLLLLLSYLMQQRSNQETIDGLKTSVSTMQSVEDLIEDNQLLHNQVSEMEAQINTLTQSRQALEAQVQDQDQALTAMDWLWRIQRAYSKGSKKDARELVDQFEATGLSHALPQTALSGVDGPSPAEQYNALLDALNYRPDP